MLTPDWRLVYLAPSQSSCIDSRTNESESLGTDGHFAQTPTKRQAKTPNHDCTGVGITEVGR